MKVRREYPLHKKVKSLDLLIKMTRQTTQTITGAVILSHQGEEGAEEGDGAEVSNVGVHVIVLLLGEQRVVTLDTTALHILVPTGLNVCLYQGSFTLA